MRTVKPLPPTLLLPLALRLARGARATGAVRRRHPGEPRHLALAHLLDHARHLLARLEQLVDLLHGGAAAARDALAPRAVDDVRQAPLLRRHREDDPLHPRQLALVDVVEAVVLLSEPGDHLEHALQRA